MRRWRCKTLTLFLILLGSVVLQAQGAGAVCNLIGSIAKPDSSSQTLCSELRTSPTDRLAPGFDPSKLLTHSFPGEVGGTASIDSALELFVTLGPGEVTGNMHGQLLDRTGTTCTEMGGPIGHECAGVNNISLGRAKFNPASQGDTPPSSGSCVDSTGKIISKNPNDTNPPFSTTSPSSPYTLTNPPPNAGITCSANDTAGYLRHTFTTQGDFFPFQINHVGFDSVINYEAAPGQTASPKTGVLCTAPIGSTCVNSSQTVKQVTGVFGDLGTGTFSSPGAGDQLVINNIAAWSVQGNGDLKFTSPTIAWTQQVVDPDFSGVAIQGFNELVSGSFTYCQGPHVLSAGITTAPCQNNDVPVASYTTGNSQFNGAFSTLGGD